MRWFNFAFIGAFQKAPFIHRSARCALQELQAPSAPEVLNVNVGGFPYSIHNGDIQKSSRLSQILSDCGFNGEFTPIERNGKTFKFVHAFLVNGQLPRDNAGKLALDEATLSNIREEAEYFQIDGLKEESERWLSVPEPIRTRDFLATMRKCELPEPLEYLQDDTSLSNVLRDTWSPVCVERSWFVGMRQVYKDGEFEDAHSVEEFLRAIREHANLPENAHTSKSRLMNGSLISLRRYLI